MDLKKYIGIPYKEHGSSFAGCDCYGLIRLIYSEELEIKLPDYACEDRKNKKQIYEAIERNIQDWKKIYTVDPGKSVILINIHSFPIHMGLVVSKTEMIHTMKNHASVMETFTSFKWSTRIEGYYQWK